jgi:hypothetical protein
MEEDTIKPHKKSYDWLKQYQFQKGNNANPNGRPKGKSLKTFVREMLESMDDESKALYLKDLDPEMVWKMAEGNPHSTSDNTTELIIPKPISNVLRDNSISEDKQPNETN